MRLILSPKDSPCKKTLTNVESYGQEGHTLLVKFNDGITRNYPLAHFWYYEPSQQNGLRPIGNGSNEENEE